MAVEHSITAKNTATDAVTALVNGGTLVLYDGETLLVELTLGTPAFAAAVNGTAALNAVDPAQAVAAGEADNFELCDSGGDPHIAGTVSMAGGGGDLILDNTNIANGQNVGISSLTYTALSQ